MKKLKREDLRQQLRQNEIAPVYTLFGPEIYLRDIAARTIADRSFAESDFRDFNDTVFSLAEPDGLRAALAAAEQLPMMAARRVVRVKDVRVSATGARDTLKEEHEALLRRYLERPCETTVLIFVADELNGVRKLGRLLTENSVAVEFALLSDAELEKWARDRIREFGAEIDEATLRRLVAMVGADTCRLTNEVKKLATAALPDRQITSELLDDLAVRSRELGNFILADRLASGAKADALRTLKIILDDGAEPVMLLGMLAYSFRRLLIVKDLMDTGASRAEAAKILNVRYGEQEPLFAAARRLGREKLTKIIQRLADADLAIKTSLGGGGNAGGRLQIEMLACEILLS